MRTILCFLSLGAALLGASADYTVHEWGTFTSVVGSDGRMLSGLEIEEERVPPFVIGLAGFSSASKGILRPVSGVTVKMETPVLYFYSSEPRSVRVDVGFRGGAITQWYPDRIGGEQLPRIAAPQRGELVPPLNFSPSYRGAASWQVDVLAPDSPLAISAPRKLETPQWPRARVAQANRIRGSKGEVEGFIFYRGIGNFALPLQVTATDGGRILRNAGDEPIPFAFIYENRAPGGEGVVWWSGALAAGEQVIAATREDCGHVSAGHVIEDRFPRELVRAGLTREEAEAMIATWRESYFQRPGLRLFWIVPRVFTDAILPITLTPRPAKLERVLVGRTEILTPTFERELTREFAVDGGKRWIADRYYRAYRERVRQLGGVVDVAPERRVP
jgi:hypothetical protein